MDTLSALLLICFVMAWWRHQMETFSALLAICAGNSPVPGEFPTQRPVTRSFDVYFDLRPDNRLSKQSWGWWFETLSHSWWRHCNGKPPVTGPKGTSNAEPRCFLCRLPEKAVHYSDVIMGAMASQITSLAIVYSTFFSAADQRRHQSSASLAFVRGIHRWPVNSPHKCPVTRKMFSFNDVIMWKTIELSVIWEVKTITWRHCNAFSLGISHLQLIYVTPWNSESAT